MYLLPVVPVNDPDAIFSHPYAVLFHTYTVKYGGMFEAVDVLGSVHEYVPELVETDCERAAKVPDTDIV